MTEANQAQTDVDLRPFNTMGIAARAPRVVLVHSIENLPAAMVSPAELPVVVLGAGSNIILSDTPHAQFVRILDDAVEFQDDAEDPNVVLVRVNAGKVWHSLVMDCVARSLHGIENLALIPGTAGASPIQNIGAYGVEVKDVIREVLAFEPRTGVWHRFDNTQCEFTYRESIFKQDISRFVIAQVTYALSRQAELKLSYAGIEEQLRVDGIDMPTVQDVANAVITVRNSKLPDPAKLGNAGSFFKNPLIPFEAAEAMSEQHPGIPLFRGSSDANRKVSAAWLIEQAGWKGFREGDVGISPDHALVMVNYGNATGSDIRELASRVIARVSAKFGITLEPEPRFIQ